jgi:hypothetical protein
LYRWEWQKPPYPPAVRNLGKAIVIFGATFVGLVAIASALAAWGLIDL